MSNSIHSLQLAGVQAETDQTVQAPKTAQATTNAVTHGDTVTISKAAQEALATNNKPVSNGDGH